MNKNAKPQPYKADSEKEPIQDRPRIFAHEELIFSDQLDAIWHTIAETLDCSLDVVSRRSRHRQFARARQLFFYFARKQTMASLREIGQYAGGRDHSTVIHGVAIIENEMRYKSFKTVVETIERNLTGRVPAAEDPELRVKLFCPYLGFIAGG
jgi:hypothetical protein